MSGNGFNLVSRVLLFIICLRSVNCEESLCTASYIVLYIYVFHDGGGYTGYVLSPDTNFFV